jgi:F-type H+-transporting ATPase subunit delta
VTAPPDAQQIARTLYETLLDNVVAQLQRAAKKLKRIDARAPDVAQQVEKALPKDLLPEVRNFLLSLAQEGMLDQLNEALEAFEHHVRGTTRPVPAQVTSAIELDKAQQQRIARELNQRYQADLDVRFVVDETLIGGLIIRVGDQVVDNSLRTRLGSIQRNMLSS